MEKNIEGVLKATALLKTIANKNRLMILCQIIEEELTVTDLYKSMNLSQSAISQHLALMRKEGFVKTRREQKNIYYSISSKEIKDIINTLYKNFCDVK